MTRYHANHKVTKNQLNTGFDTMEEAKAHAEFLADTYGGTATAAENRMGAGVHKYSTKRGWFA